MRTLSAIILASAALTLSPTASAWGPNGHAIVADIAMRILSDPATGSPSTVAKINALLPYAKTLDPATLPVSTLADISSAPDAYRGNGHDETAQWHFVDIPLAEDTFDVRRDCHYLPDGKTVDLNVESCVVAKLPEFVTVLEGTKPDLERGQALAYVVHFVGDIHQPLHAENNNDRGGNSVTLVWDKHSDNLHSIWDGAILEDTYKLPHPKKDVDPNKNYKVDLAPAAKVAANLVKPASCAGVPADWAPVGLTKNFGPVVVAWAQESHDLAKSAYAKFNPDATGWQEDYAAFAKPIIDCQLLRAGTRLAQVLREALP
jgi:hypothetical protein